MSGTLRMPPVFAPRMVSMTTGRFCTCTDRVSPVCSIVSTCLRTHPVGLGMKSVSGMVDLLGFRGGVSAWRRFTARGRRGPSGQVSDNSFVARGLPQVDTGVDGVPVDLRELLGAELEVLHGIEAVVELLDGRRADEHGRDPL